MRYYITPVRMAIIKKPTNNKSWWGCGEKGILIHCWWEYILVQSLWKTVWSFLKKLKIELLYDPEILLLGIYLKKKNKPKTLSGKDTRTMCTEALFTVFKVCKRSNCSSTDEWIKTWYTYNGKLLSHKKEWTWMDLEGIMLSEISQTEKDKYCVLLLWNL